MNSQSVRVRMAPSPTGNLHVGTARAALFNELFAQHEQGTFIIRVEDTDAARSKPEFEQAILEGFKWLGLTWDEGPDVGGPYGPYRQSERKELHEQAIKQLLDSGAAYIDEKANNVVRLKVEPQEVTFTDLVRGDVTQHTDSWGGDFVIARSVTDPLFHLAVVVDDEVQAITHVIRGEDHVSNTARHILIQRALGYRTPQYAHLPLLLDEQRKKLSKRNNETNLLAYRDLGYLPEAMLNYLALLGWNPKNDQEFLSHDELAQLFTLDGVQKGGAIFSIVKLQAMNKHYIRQLSPAVLLEQATPFLEKAGYTLDNKAYWQAAVQTEQERISTLADLVEAVAFFKPDWAAEYPAERLVWKKSTAEATKGLLEQLITVLNTYTDDAFTATALQDQLMAWIDDNKLGRGDTLWPMRVALSGREHSPGPFEIAAVLGKITTISRLEQAKAKL